MSGYRRFVAYVYEYVNDQKGENKGFIKVEARNGQCRMYFRLNGKRGWGVLPCKIYGFVREGNACQTILLGKCNLVGEMVEFQLETAERQMAGSAYALSDLAGILIGGEHEVRYATQWDDIPIRMSDFILYKEEIPDKEEISAPEILEQEESVSVEVLPQQDELSQDLLEQEEHTCRETEEPEVTAEEVFLQETEWDFQPFADGEIPFCKKITLQDISMRNNFLLHGYENYQHLLVGKMPENNQYILGIPGIYDPQERFMAGVFGFPNFKAARREGEMLAAEDIAERPIFGYWYRLVDAADLNL